MPEYSDQIVIDFHPLLKKSGDVINDRPTVRVYPVHHLSMTKTIGRFTSEKGRYVTFPPCSMIGLSMSQVFEDEIDRMKEQREFTCVVRNPAGVSMNDLLYATEGMWNSRMASGEIGCEIFATLACRSWVYENGDEMASLAGAMVL